jgi:HAMP domain-containing protein
MKDIRGGGVDERSDNELHQPAPDWKRAHEELVRLAKSRARLDRDEGRWLVVAAREGTHARLGYASFVEYVERLFGYSPRFTLEKLRVAEALEKLPALGRALDEGSLSWSVARELTRVAVPETEGEWLAGAAGRTARDVERLVSGHARGSKPSEAPDPRLRRHVIRLEVSGEAFAAFRDALAKLRRDAGTSLDDDEAVLLLARHVLGGPIPRPTEVGMTFRTF